MSQSKVIKTGLVIFLPLFVVTLFTVVTFYYSRTDANKIIIEQSEENRLQILAKYLNADIGSIISDLRFLAALSKENQLDQQTIQEDFYYFSKSKKIYDQIRILNHAGMETVRINYNSGHPSTVPPEKMQNKKGRYYFDDTLALNQGEVFISPLDLNVEKGSVEMPIKPMIRFGLVLYDEHENKSGILLLNYLASHLLDRIKDFQQASEGNSFLLNKDGYYLYAENPDISWGFMYPERNRADNNINIHYPDAWTTITQSVKGQFETDAGLFTFSTIHPLAAGAKSSTGSGFAVGTSKAQLGHEEYFWKLVSFVPNDKLYTYDRSLQTILFYFFIIATGIIGVGSYRFGVVKQKGEEAEEEVKVLQGIIPICMHCKEIRSDEGLWTRMEQYITEHSEAEFSHGICEKCMKEKYGDFVD